MRMFVLAYWIVKTAKERGERRRKSEVSYLVERNDKMIELNCVEDIRHHGDTVNV